MSDYGYSGFIKDFVEEAEEHLENLNKDLVELEKAQPELDEEKLSSMMRIMHTVKGLARILDLFEIVEMCHKAEDVLGILKDRDIHLDQNVADILFDTFDTIEKQVLAVRKTGSDQGIDSSNITGRIEGLLNGQ